MKNDKSVKVFKIVQFILITIRFVFRIHLSILFCDLLINGLLIFRTMEWKNEMVISALKETTIGLIPLILMFVIIKEIIMKVRASFQITFKDLYSIILRWLSYSPLIGLYALVTLPVAKLWFEKNFITVFLLCSCILITSKILEHLNTEILNIEYLKANKTKTFNQVTLENGRTFIIGSTISGKTQSMNLYRMNESSREQQIDSEKRFTND